MSSRSIYSVCNLRRLSSILLAAFSSPALEIHTFVTRNKYGKTAAQVALRWLTQRGIVAIPKSSHKERMVQNINIFDFKLTDDDMAQIAKMNQHDAGTRDFGDPQFVKYLIETYG